MRFSSKRKLDRDVAASRQIKLSLSLGSRAPAGKSVLQQIPASSPP